MPRWLFDVIVAAGSFFGAIATIRVALVRPIRKFLQKLEALLDLPDAMRELTQTMFAYVSETEPRLSRLEEGLALVARTLRIRLGIKEGNDGER